jgi:hypothetical protein
MEPVPRRQSQQFQQRSRPATPPCLIRNRATAHNDTKAAKQLDPELGLPATGGQRKPSDPVVHHHVPGKPSQAIGAIDLRGASRTPGSVLTAVE